jgi:hypothetical protein
MAAKNVSRSLARSVLVAFGMHYPKQEINNYGVGRMKCLSVGSFLASVRPSESYVNIEHPNAGIQEVSNVSRPSVIWFANRVDQDFYNRGRSRRSQKMSSNLREKTS